MSIKEIVTRRKLKVLFRFVKHKMLTTVNRFPANIMNDTTNTVVIKAIRISGDALLNVCSPLTFSDSMTLSV